MTKTKIPVRISPFFWVVAVLIGWLYSHTVVGTFLWIGIIFVSVLFHEFGHAVMARAFGQRPRIELVAFGGVTYPFGKRLPLFKEFLVVLAGPFFGFLLFLGATGLLQLGVIHTRQLLLASVKALQVINLIWTILNLLPVIPLDGGQLLRILCEALFKEKGMKVSLIASMVFTLLLSFWFFLTQWFLAGALFFLFAFQNFQMYRQLGVISRIDEDEGVRQQLKEGEAVLAKGDEEEAIRIFETLRAKTKEGSHFLFASEQLARLYYKKGEKWKTLELLTAIRKHISAEALQLLHLVAFELGKFALVAELAGDAFQVQPSADVALRNALACAGIKNVLGVVGWLKASIKYGLDNIQEVVAEKGFDSIRDEGPFQEFLASLIHK